MNEQYGLEIWRLLHHIGRNNKKSFRLRNLTELETRVLFTADKYNKMNHQSITIRDLKDRLHVSSPTISQVVNDLEHRDIVKRTKDESDGRITRVEVSTKGKEELKRAFSVVEDQFQALGEFLGEEKSKLLIELLNEMAIFFTKEDNYEKEDNCEHF